MFEKHAEEDNENQDSVPVSEVNEIETSIRMIAKYVKDQTTEIKKTALTRQEMREEISRVRSEVIPLIDKLEMKIDKISSQKSTGEIEGKMDKIESRVSDLMHMKSRHDEIEQKVKDLHSAIGEKALSGTTEDRSLVEAHVRRIDELEKKIENMHKIVTKGSQGIVLAKLRDEMKKDMEDYKSEMAARMKYSSQEPRVPGDIDASMSRHSESLANMEKQFSEIKYEVDGMKREMLKIKNMPSVKGGQVETKINEEVLDEMSDLRKMVEEEGTLHASFDKRVTDLAQEVKKISLSADKLKKFESLDYERLVSSYEKSKKFDEELEKKMKVETMKMVAKQLDDFVKTLDKKMPHLATKDDLEKMKADLKLPKTDLSKAAPGTDAVERRMMMLERRVSELVNALQGYQGSFIIE